MSITLSLEDQVVQMLFEASGVPVGDIAAETRLVEDLGMDSISSMEFLSMLAERLDVEIDLEDAMDVKTTADAVELVRRHLDG